MWLTLRPRQRRSWPRAFGQGCGRGKGSAEVVSTMVVDVVEVASMVVDVVEVASMVAAAKLTFKAG